MATPALRKVTAALDGGSITSNAGALLLRKIDRALGFFDRVVGCLTDHRDARLTEHSVRTLVAQRIAGIALLPASADRFLDRSLATFCRSRWSR